MSKMTNEEVKVIVEKNAVPVFPLQIEYQDWLAVIMKDYKLTIKNIKHYKSKACEMVGNNCNRCEGAYEYNNKVFCVFDTVNRFIEWYNKYKR